MSVGSPNKIVPTVVCLGANVATGIPVYRKSTTNGCDDFGSVINSIVCWTTPTPLACSSNFISTDSPGGSKVRLSLAAKQEQVVLTRAILTGRSSRFVTVTLAIRV